MPYQHDDNSFRSPDNDKLNKLIQQFKQFFMKPNAPQPSLHLPRVIGAIVLVILVIWILLGIFIVAPAEEAVIVRFGRYQRTEQPGPHWLPLFIEKKYIVNVQQISTYSYQAEMLTEDENIVSVAVAIQYRVDNPSDYLFNVVNPVNTLKQVTSSALRQSVGQMSLNAILTTGREKLRNQVAKQLKKTLLAYKPGLQIVDVNLQATRPPEAVVAAFNDAVKAREDSQRYINKGQAYARRVLLSARGQIARITAEADAYKAAVVLSAKGDVARYNALLKPYLASPKVTRERLYLDAMNRILTKTFNIIISSDNHNLLYLPLKQLLPSYGASATSKAPLTHLPSTPASGDAQ